MDSPLRRPGRHQRHSGRLVVVPLVALGSFRCSSPRFTALALPRGRACWILLKLALVYLLIAYTGGIQSNFWLLLLLPVVSAATAPGSRQR